MQTLFKFKQFVDEINKENGRLYKQSILNAYSDDEDIKFYLHWIFSPYVVTGISDKKLNKAITVPIIEMHSVSMKFIFDYLTKHKTGTDIDIGWIQAVRNYITDLDTKDLFNAVVTKNLSLGIDAKTINKCIPGCVEEFNVQLANKYFEDPDRLEGKEFAITTKIDGGRIIALKENGEVKFYTRQGQLYEGLVDLEEEMKQFMPDNTCLDGELTLLDPGTLVSKDQYKQTMKISRKDGDKHGLKMLVFDWMPADCFRKQLCNLPYYARRSQLELLFGITESFRKFKYFSLLPVLYQGTDTKEVSKWLDYSVNNGEEGIMINITDAPYSFTRTWDLMKVKKMQTLDLEVVDYFEGNKSFSGMLGGFIVRYKEGNRVRVGSGFDKEFRLEAWKNPAQYIGKIIEVRYFEETSNDNGGISLRFPVFVDIRTDKNVADY